MSQNEHGGRLLIVDDEPQIRKLLKVTLQAHGYVIDEASTGESALIQAANLVPDLIVLDLGLPDISGMEVLRRIREWSNVPILMLTAKDRETDKIEALDNGADDYVTKPFGMGELIARIRVALRHANHNTPHDSIVRVGELAVDLAQHVAELQGVRLKLTPTEYELLKVLALHAGKVVPQRQLLQQVWGDGYNESDSHYLRVYIGHLRKKLDEDHGKSKYIVTEPGIGYRLLARE
jgi:two-component system KDP operon response regulator KdpE